jgi:signal peptidase I
MADARAVQAAAPEPEGVKETLESIIVALILAFVFRAFIVEAFVIPTGSMAPTLYGAHGTIVCEDCGVEFAYGLKDLADPRKLEPVGANARAVCPNCNHANTNLTTNDERRNREKGDRILVLKWPFDIGGRWLAPARWDVIVFKDPADGVTNFIKRLAGLPNEVLEIVDGDVYTVPVSELSDRAQTVFEEMRHHKYQLRTEQVRGAMGGYPPDVLKELDEKMRIARKTPVAQESLWFLVYDHDYPPRTLGPHQPRWRAMRGEESGWDASNRRVRFEPRGVADDYIELFGKRIVALCAYNVHRSRAPDVPDLRVGLVLTPKDGAGVLRIRLDKRGRVFWATVGMDGTVSLTESSDVPGPSAPVMARKQLAPLVPGRPLEIRFENVDYRLALFVGGEEVLASSDDPDSPAYYAPDLSALRRGRLRASAAPRIYGEGGAFDLTHLVVERDVYYYHDPQYRALPMSWAPPGGWGSPESPILLREHEFFMLGDNTAASKDSRLWDQPGPHLEKRGEAFQLGTVPEDQLIGKAFFVYWPGGHKLEWLPRIGDWDWAIIPDVGRMRWIR